MSAHASGGRGKRGKTQRERERERERIQANSPLSVEPNLGLDPMRS